MALIVNSTSIPSSGKVIYNSASLDKVNYKSTNVWQRGLNILEQNKWTTTAAQDGSFTSSATQLRLMAKWRSDWWNWIVVRSNAQNLTGFSKITVTWDNEGAWNINFPGWVGFSTNANLKQGEGWGDTRIEYVVVHTDPENYGGDGVSGTKTITIPSSWRKNGVYIYAQRNYYASTYESAQYFKLTKIEIT